MPVVRCENEHVLNTSAIVFVIAVDQVLVPPGFSLTSANTPSAGVFSTGTRGRWIVVTVTFLEDELTGC